MNCLNSANPISGDFRNLLEACPQPVVLFRSSDGRPIEVNDLFCLLVDQPREKILGGWLSDDAHETDQFARLKPVGAIDLEWVPPDGNSLRLPARMKDLVCGGKACVVAFVDDPAERPRKERFQIEDRWFRDIVENINDILYATDENGIITYISPNIETLSGYLSSEVVGRNAVEFIYPDDQAERLVHFLKILAGEALTSEYRMVTKTGDVRWVRTSVRCRIRHGQVAGTQGVLIDISDRKAIEEALRQSEEKYRVLVQNAKDAVFVIQNGRIAFVNPSACILLGCVAEMLKGSDFSEFVHPDDRPALAKCLALLETNQPCDPLAFRLAGSDGAFKQVELVAALIPWEERPAALFFLRDITLQVRMEEQLRNAQKLEAIGTLTSGIVHNFNNLLMGINGNASLCLLHLESEDPARAYTEKILRLVESGSKLTAQLLDYARSGKSRVQPMDLNQLVREACETLSATQKHIPVHLSLAQELPYIKADKSQIEQVLLNLLLNAVDAMPSGGDIHVQTRIETGVGTLAETFLEDHTPYVLLTVADSGVGMSPEVQARVFEPFFTTKAPGRGTGLGLSTAHGIIQNHGGTIKVHSLSGHGSRFEIYLPAVEKPKRAAADLSRSQKIQGRGTILVVDDEMDVLETSAELLEHSGFSVLKATDGDAALDIYQRCAEQIDLVMIDIVMPGMNGKELFHRIRQMNPQAKVLFFSGYSLDQQLEQMLRNGCAAFLQKPYDHQVLCYKIMEIIA
jgi:PAS domain S-box-containing protein